MPSSGLRLAQFNIATARHDLDDPRMSGFTDAVDGVNARADASPGFVWRLQSDEGDALDLRFGENPRTIINLSVWESLDALRAFYLGQPHGEFLRRRGEWFERASEPYVVLWWVARGHLPDLDEAGERLASLRRLGSTPEAFDFAHVFETTVRDRGG